MHVFKTRIVISFAIMSAILAIPICFRDQLKFTYPTYYWANSGNIFLDWGFIYLNFIPIWFIFSIVWITGLGWRRFVKYMIMFYLGYWLFYDWTWWFLVESFKPNDFAWIKTFYFDIIIPNPPYWFFFLVSLTGGLLSIYVAYKVRELRQLVPFVLYLVYIYGLGAITEITPMPLAFYQAWSFIFVPMLLVIFLLTRKNKSRFTYIKIGG